MIYTVCLYKVSDGYAVLVPDVAGCFSAGNTIAEALKNTKEAIIFHIEGILEDGGEIPPPKEEVHRANPELKNPLYFSIEVNLDDLLNK